MTVSSRIVGMGQAAYPYMVSKIRECATAQPAFAPGCAPSLRKRQNRPAKVPRGITGRVEGRLSILRRRSTRYGLSGALNGKFGLLMGM